MQVIEPIQNSALEITSTNVAVLENAWSTDSGYVAGYPVQHEGVVYAAVQDMDSTSPAPGEATDPLEEYWFRWGVTNPNKPFDGLISSQAIGPPTTTYVLAITEYTGGVALIGMGNVTSFSISMNDSAGTLVYTNTVDLLDTVTGLYKTDEILLDLPLYSVSEITINLYATVEVLISAIILGRVHELGYSKYGGSTSIIDYSIKKTDTFGNFIVNQKAFSRRLEADLLANSSKFKEYYNLLTEIRSSPVVWITTDRDKYSNILIAYGFYRDFEIKVINCSTININLSIEGLSEGSYGNEFTWDESVWRYRLLAPEYWVKYITADTSNAVTWEDELILGGEPATYNITNPGAETPIVAPWITESGVWGQRNVSPTPSVGAYYFEASGSNQCILSQEVDVIAAGMRSYDIDTGQTNFTVEYLQAASSSNYLGGLYLRYLDSNKDSISESTPTIQNFTSWTAQTHIDRLPVGTRYIKIVLRADVYSGAVGAYFDNIVATTIISPTVSVDSKGRTYFELNGFRYTKGLNVKG
jgi:hypothetical protein